MISLLRSSLAREPNGSPRLKYRLELRGHIWDLENLLKEHRVQILEMRNVLPEAQHMYVIRVVDFDLCQVKTIAGYPSLGARRLKIDPVMVCLPSKEDEKRSLYVRIEPLELMVR